MYICRMGEYEQIQDTYEYSNGELAALLGERFRNYRNSLGLSQKDVAHNSGVSIMTIVRFERGQGHSIRLDNLIALFRAIQRLDDIMELVSDMPESLYAKKRRK
jgi:transcriptional regulator with XRE-family HTH domain